MTGGTPVPPPPPTRADDLVEVLHDTPVADPDGEQHECHEGNNVGLQPNVACDTVD